MPSSNQIGSGEGKEQYVANASHKDSDYTQECICVKLSVFGLNGVRGCGQEHLGETKLRPITQWL